MARSTWSVYTKVGTYWIPDGTFYRPNEIFTTTKVNVQSKTQRADGQNAYMTPSTKFINETINFIWYYDGSGMKNKIEGYVENQSDVRIIDHSSREFIGRFISVTPNWLVGEDPDRYDIQAVFELVPLLTASSSSSSFSSSSLSSSATA